MIKITIKLLKINELTKFKVLKIKQLDNFFLLKFTKFYKAFNEKFLYLNMTVFSNHYNFDAVALIINDGVGVIS